MADIADAFEQHLRSLSDDEWNQLAARVRTPSVQHTENGAGFTSEVKTPEVDRSKPGPGESAEAGLEEARRRGYID